MATLTLAEALRQPCQRGKGRKATHPLTALFGALQAGTAPGMQYVTDRGGIFSDLWERYPEPEEVTVGEVIACFEAAKRAGRLNPVWCDEWILAVQERIFD